MNQVLIAIQEDVSFNSVSLSQVWIASSKISSISLFSLSSSANSSTVSQVWVKTAHVSVSAFKFSSSTMISSSSSNTSRSSILLSNIFALKKLLILGFFLKCFTKSFVFSSYEFDFSTSFHQFQL